jgi:hypothetical protein
MPSVPISFPAQYAPGVAMSFRSADGDATLVSQSQPLPVMLAGAESASKPGALTGTVSGITVVGPFTPALGTPVWISLLGTWTGTVRLLRSTNGGVSKLGLTAGGVAYALYSGNACEPAFEESENGATLYLDVRLSAGAVSYRLSQ